MVAHFRVLLKDGTYSIQEKKKFLFIPYWQSLRYCNSEQIAGTLLTFNSYQEAVNYIEKLINSRYQSWGIKEYIKFDWQTNTFTHSKNPIE